MSEDNQGSVAKGVLLNIGLNLFICVLWLPLCGLGSGYSSNNLASQIGVLFFFAMIGIGIVQLLHVIPMMIYFHKQDKPETVKGVRNAAIVTFILWGIVVLGTNWF